MASSSKRELVTAGERKSRQGPMKFACFLLLPLIVVVILPLIFGFAQFLPNAPTVEVDDYPKATAAHGLQSVVDWSNARLKWAEANYTAHAATRYPSPETWHKEVFYYVMVDRFSNGDLKNDNLNIPSFQGPQIKSGEPYTISDWRHGGDLEGLRQRLSYIKHLGASVIWLSPVLLNNKGKYHGYGLSDPAKVDPGFGNAKLLRKVVREAHEMGIRVVMDMVINHIQSKSFGFSPVTNGQASSPGIDDTTSCALMLENQYWNMTIPPDPPNNTFRSPVDWGFDMPDYLRSAEFFARCGGLEQYRPDNIALDQLNSTIEQNLPLKDAGWQWPEFFETSYMELDTMNVHLQEVFTNLLKYWIAYADIDGFRLDAMQHVDATFSAYLITHARAYAKELGKDNFYVIGEMDINSAPFPYLYLGRIPQAQASRECSAHAGCAGLVGNCCPADNDMVLACCTAQTVEPGGVFGAARDQAVPQMLKRKIQELEPLCDQLGNASCPGAPAAYPLSETYYIRAMADGTKNASAWFSDSEWIWGMANQQRLLTEQADLASAWLSPELQDTPRLLSMGMGTQGYDVWRSVAAQAVSMTWSFIPTINNGFEQGMNGFCMESGDPNNNFLDDGLDELVRDSILKGCNYSDGPDKVQQGYWRQDMFPGPMRLGSAIPSVDKQALIRGRMQESLGPHWCEEPLLDTSVSNAIFHTTRALSRIRRSCPAVRSNRVRNGMAEYPEQLAYWKFTSVPGTAPEVLVIVNFIEKPYWTAVDIAMPDDTPYSVGEEFVDMLHPSRVAKVVKLNSSRLALRIDEVLDDPAHASVWAHNSFVVNDEYASWMVCKGEQLPPLPSLSLCQPSLMIATWIGFGLWLLMAILPLIALCTNLFGYSGVYLCLVTQPSPVELPANPTPLPADVDSAWPKHVFVAAIEHTIPERKVKVSAGGLGKVLDQMLREHPPGVLSLVHPMVSGVNYGEMASYCSLDIMVDMQKQTVNVHRIEAESHGLKKHWYILEHPWFTALTTGAPYPYPQTKLSVLRFFSLWNQTCAELMSMLDPDIYHCMDYHAALVPLYNRGKKLCPTIIVLHNADYDGSIETDSITDVLWQTVHPLRRLSLIFNLEIEAIRKYMQFEGRFNMLYGGIASISETQDGYGVCTVSGNYAAELKRERTLFKHLPEVLALDNAIDGAADDGPKNVQELVAQRVKSKKMLQEFCGLDVDDKYKILIFIGRWVKQKGVDNIALRAPTILDNNPDVQFVLAGPPGDPYGSYAQELLRPLVDEYPGRLFVVTEFFMIPKEARAGAHFCLMPSISEPFGYVDVEFGLVGVPSLGCAIGGLGKMPGVYFRQQNSDSSDMMLSGYNASVDYALNMPEEDYWEMAFACISAQFPFSTWRENLMEIYRKALVHFDPDAKGNNDEITLDDETGFNVLQAGKDRTAGGFRRLNTKKQAQAKSVMAVANQLQRMQVAAATEFLQQPVSEERIREIMREWMATAQDPDTDAETLQAHISLQNEKNNEKNLITKALMSNQRGCKDIFEDTCLRIHTVIALGYILSPVVDIKQSAVIGGADVLGLDYWGALITSSIGYLGTAFGALLWLMLSRQVPAYLLMAAALFISMLFFYTSQQIESASIVWVEIFSFLGGMLASSRLLFLVWNFSEDFHGGFQVGARRVAVVESCRQALQWTLRSVSLLDLDKEVWNVITTPFAYIYIILVFMLTVLIMLAPSCYQTCVLPQTGFMKELKDHKVYLFLMASLCFSGLASAPAHNDAAWLSANGWNQNEQAIMNMITAIAIVIVLTAIFMPLHRMSVWGPWAMRDFTCLVPPGSLLRVLAFYELGTLHYKSTLFVAVLTLSHIMDAARYAAFWTAILTTLANKWYAIFGGFICLGLVALCWAPSAFLTHMLGNLLTGASPTFSSVIANHPQIDTQHLQLGGLVTVWILDGIAYMLQICARPYFDMEVLTFKGYGHLMPDNTVGWPGSSMHYANGRNAVKTKHDRDSDSSDSEDDETGYSSENASA
eukprot:CAMPEP_0195080476 /NCGR_PEP_ID=MMETSP0448-20130528/22166_1 /TAXON_ID=66468 /ORGANISM="Heterocapsa triquestra, Strain CCMP 448" /LENGTH=1999 /DNA_ID=CAMNT_0040113429 /DNA_START=61 /DNA_END=6060 /DNA_ORIENTATION=+